MVDLVRCAAVAAAGCMPAQIGTSADAARDQLVDLSDAHQLAAAAGCVVHRVASAGIGGVAGPDDAGEATAAVHRLRTASASSRPGAGLSTAMRATELVALNDAPHPPLILTMGKMLAE
jgi:phage tail tape-measure protein